MICKKCGTILAEGDAFCKICGEKVAIDNPIPVSPAQAPVQPVVEPQPIAAPVIDENQTVTESLLEPTPIVAPTVNTDELANNFSNVEPETLSQPVMPTPMQPTPMPSTTVNSTPAVQTPVENYTATAQAPIAPTPVQNTPVMPTYSATPKKGNNTILIVLVVLIIALLGAICAYLLFTREAGILSGQNSNPEVSTLSQKSTYKIRYNNFSLSIPDNYTYQDTSSGLLISDNVDSWVASILISEGNYSSISANKDQFRSYLQSSGFTIGDIKTTKYGSHEAILIEASLSGKYELVAITKVNSQYVGIVDVFTIDNDYAYDKIQEIVEILSSAEYVGGAINSLSPSDSNILSVIKSSLPEN